MMELEEGSGTEESDAELLKKADKWGTPDQNERYVNRLKMIFISVFSFLGWVKGRIASQLET